MPATGQMSDGTAPTVFVVDDEGTARRALARLIHSFGIDVQTFASAREFLGYQRPDSPACLILEVRLAGENGLMVQEALRAVVDAPPIIFLTGHGTIPLCVQAMKAGAVDFLTNPVQREALFSAVKRAANVDAASRQRRNESKSIGERISTLTHREREVLEYVIAGRLNKQIAASLGTVEKTVKVHRGRLMAKLGVRTVADLVRLADKAGIAPAHSMAG